MGGSSSSFPVAAALDPLSVGVGLVGVLWESSEGRPRLGGVFFLYASMVSWPGITSRAYEKDRGARNNVTIF